MPDAYRWSQFLDEKRNLIAPFTFARDDRGNVRLAEEKHYCLVPSSSTSAAKLQKEADEQEHSR